MGLLPEEGTNRDVRRAVSEIGLPAISRGNACVVLPITRDGAEGWGDGRPAMTDATREYGVYRSPSSPSGKLPPAPIFNGGTPGLPGWVTGPQIRPGTCFTWEEKMKELPPICGDAALAANVWNDIEGLAYLYIWHVVLSF